LKIFVGNKVIKTISLTTFPEPVQVWPGFIKVTQRRTYRILSRMFYRPEALPLAEPNQSVKTLQYREN